MRYVSFVISVFAFIASGPAMAASATDSGGRPPVGGPPPGVASQSSGPHIDRDGNGIADALEQRLSGMAAGERVDVVVRFAVRADRAAAERAVGAFTVYREFSIIPGFAASMTAAQVQGLARVPGVVMVEEDFEVTTQLDGARADFGADRVNAGSPAYTGAGVGICIIDTGIDDGHEQFDDVGKIAGWTDLVNNQPDPYDDHGHGSHVANIAAGAGTGGPSAPGLRGVAPGAKIYAVKTLNSAGSAPESTVITAVEWCANQLGVHIISMSLGTAGGSNGQDSLSVAVNNAVTNYGKIAVIAAGNSGPGNETVGSPGAAAQAITVGAAANYTGDHGVYLVSFSSRGPTLDGRLKPEIVAPGVRINAAAANSADGNGDGASDGYFSISGTSMATPFAAGALALAVQASGFTLTPALAKTYLAQSAQDRGAAGGDNEYGHGLIDVYHLAALASGCSSAMPCTPTSLPQYQRFEASVASGGTWFSPDIVIGADAVNVPIAAIVTINGQPICPYGASVWCDLLGGWEWNPDLDEQLVNANGSGVSANAGDITLSECQLSGEWCGSVKGAARQETVHYIPRTTGTFKIKVYSFSGAGSFAVDLSTGPVVAATPPPPDTNEAPVAVNDSVTAKRNRSKVIAVLANDSDPDGDPLTVSSVADPPNGTTIINGDGTVTYTPTTGFIGTDSFNYSVSDGQGGAASALVTVKVRR